MTNDHFLDNAQKILAIPSTADNQPALQKALAFVEQQIQHLPNVTIERFERGGKLSILAYIGSKRPKRFKVLLNGHVDVVPAQIEQFRPYIKDNRLHGRGALDMKVAVLVLAKIFAQTAPSATFPIGLQIVTDEEIGGHNGTGYQIEQGIDAEFVICGEFTPANTICIESRGICTATIVFDGKSAHSAYLWEGNNAVHAANAYINKLLAHYPAPTTDTWQTTINIAAIQTQNQTFNKVPDTAEITLDIRYIPGDPIFSNKKSAQQFLAKLAPNKKTTINMHEPAHLADPDFPLTAKLAAALERTTRKKTTFIHKHGAADARFFGAPCQAVIIGLQGRGLHSDNEFVETTSIIQYTKTLTTFFESIA